jgi:hypothetical protein
MNYIDLTARLHENKTHLRKPSHATNIATADDNPDMTKKAYGDASRWLVNCTQA